MMDLGNSSAPHLTPEERKDAAMTIWNHEKGLAAAVIIVSWMFKVRSPRLTAVYPNPFGLDLFCPSDILLRAAPAQGVLPLPSTLTLGIRSVKYGVA